MLSFSRIAVAVAGFIAVVAVLIAMSDEDGYYRGKFFSRMLQRGGDATSAHKDKERAQVGWTAFAVSFARAIESLKNEGDGLVNDPVATKLFDLRLGAAPFGARVIFSLFSSFKSLFGFVVGDSIVPVLSLVAVRTRYIDDHIEAFLTSSSGEMNSQLVIIGAGLDARPFRMGEMLRSTNTMSFEVDFPGMLQEKRRIFQNCGFSYSKLIDQEKRVKHVGVDLSVPGWEDELLAQGFQKEAKTVWLLEGLTGYLTDEELKQLLGIISESSAESSLIIATWITPDNPTKLGMHRFFTNDPSAVVKPFGFVEVDVSPLGKAGKHYNRNVDTKSFHTYLLSCHRKEKRLLNVNWPSA